MEHQCCAPVFLVLGTLEWAQQPDPGPGHPFFPEGNCTQEGGLRRACLSWGHAGAPPGKGGLLSHPTAPPPCLHLHTLAQGPSPRPGRGLPLGGALGRSQGFSRESPCSQNWWGAVPTPPSGATPSSGCGVATDVFLGRVWSPFSHQQKQSYWPKVQNESLPRSPGAVVPHGVTHAADAQHVAVPRGRPGASGDPNRAGPPAAPFARVNARGPGREQEERGPCAPQCVPRVGVCRGPTLGQDGARTGSARLSWGL